MTKQKKSKDLSEILVRAIAFYGWSFLIGFYALSAALKEQARSQAAEYDRLADQYNKETGKPTSDKRVD
jgi:hypothetical protein